MPEISILIPVYKAEEYLAACMRSVLAQTYLDFEVLLIDDDSPDASDVLCDAFAKTDPRVRVIHLKNTGTGPSEARNAGLDAAKGRYLTMVDSDDTIEPDLLETLYRGARKTGAELTLCNGNRMTEDGVCTPLPAEERFTADTVLTVDEFWNEFGTPKISQFTGTAHRLYAATLFDGVRYPVGIFHEDYYILPDLIARCKAIACLAYTGYHVRQHPGSITATGRQEVRLSVTQGDIHRAAYFMDQGWFDRAEGALTDAATFLYKNKAAYDLTKPGHSAEYEKTLAALRTTYTALADAKGATPLKIKAAVLRMGLPVYHGWCALLGVVRGK